MALFRRRLKREPVGVYIFLTLLVAFTAAPLYYMIITAFKPIEELFLFPPRFYVMNPTLENFTDLLVAAGQTWVPFSRYLFNSVFITVVVVSLQVLLASMAAYPLAKHNAPGLKTVFNACVAALMFSPAVTNIPRYLIVNGLGLMDTYFALILPPLAGTFGVFLMKQFLETVPNTLLEAAKIDGASEWTIFSRIIMPLSKPAWATLTIFAFQSTWNDTWGPMVFTRSEAMKTLPLAIQTMFGGSAGNIVARAGAAAASAFLTTVPMIILFVILQKRVISTMAYAGIKG